MQTKTIQLPLSKKPRTATSWQNLASSVLIWLLVLLVFVDFGIATWRPLKHVKATQYLPLDQNPIVSKIPEFFESSVKPDVLVLGSSLPMTAIAYCDSQYAGEPDTTKFGQVRVYTKAHYLEDHLAKLTGKQLKVFNLSCYGCMSSEAYLLLSRAIDAGKKPKYVFYGVAPRDFIDNTVPAVGQTPVYEVLADWRCMNDVFARNLPWPRVVDLSVGYLWYYYRVKADYRTFLTAAVCDWLGHPATLFAAEQQKAVKPVSGGSVCTALESVRAQSKGHQQAVSGFSDSLKEYSGRYNPPNFKRWGQELSYFEKLLKLCQQENIKLIVFNMPLSADNKNLLDKKLYQVYFAALTELSQKYGTTYVNLDVANTYAKSDFLDSAHLNAAGGRKFQDCLLSFLKTHLN